MIRAVKQEDIKECVRVIVRSFMTVADEFGFTIDNAPGFTSFAATEGRLDWHMKGEHRPMYVYMEDDVIVGDYLSYRSNTVLFLLLSVIFHAVLNGVLYAKELELFVGNSIFDAWFMLVCSILIIAISSIIWKYRDKVKQIG